MRVLCVMDPLSRLDLKWDTSLCLLRELARRGHETWVADIPDLWTKGKDVFTSAKKLIPRSKLAFRSSGACLFRISAFDLVLIRKEPPFDDSYLYLTHLLELASKQVPMINHPQGIRNANEKLAILKFPRWIPETFVTSSSEKILEFQKKIKSDIVLKPLDEKGGKGVARITYKKTNILSLVKKMTKNGQKIILAQKFIETQQGLLGEKRILVLNGKVLTVYEKRPKRGDFRANLGLGGTAHAASLTAKEKKLVLAMKAYLLSEGLLFVGLDVIGGKLIEINVTCPAGLTDAIELYPQHGLVETWADSLEHLPGS